MEFSLQKMMTKDPDIIFYIPVPHFDIDEANLHKIKKSFDDEELSSTFVGVDQYACSTCWLEVAISAAKFLGICAATHYGDKILDGLDLAAKKRFDDFVAKILNALNQSVRSECDRICIHFRIGSAGREITVVRRNEEEARRVIRNGFFEIRNKIDRENGKIYWIERASFPDEGPISLSVTHWKPGSYGGSTMRIPIESDDYPLWFWLLRVRRLKDPINDIDLANFQKEFASAAVSGTNA